MPTLTFEIVIRGVMAGLAAIYAGYVYIHFISGHVVWPDSYNLRTVYKTAKLSRAQLLGATFALLYIESITGWQLVYFLAALPFFVCTVLTFAELYYRRKVAKTLLASNAERKPAEHMHSFVE